MKTEFFEKIVLTFMIEEQTNEEIIEIIDNLEEKYMREKNRLFIKIKKYSISLLKF